MSAPQAGKRTETEACVRRAANRSPGGVLPDDSGTAEIHVALGEIDRALRALEGAYRHRNGGLILLNVNPRFDSIKPDRRFQQLLQSVGLPH